MAPAVPCGSRASFSRLGVETDQRISGRPEAPEGFVGRQKFHFVKPAQA